MKKIISITSIVLLSTVAFAGGTESPKKASGMAVTKNSESGLIKVYYKAEEQADVKISIFNSKNEKVFFETVRKTDGFIRPYNLSNLKEGDYTIRIEDGVSLQTEQVKYYRDAVSKSVYVRKLSEEGKFLLTVSGEGSEEIRLNLYDSKNNLLHTETETVTHSLAKIFNVANVKDKVEFEVVHQNGAIERLKF